MPGLIYADEALIKQIEEDQAIEQVANAATLPGVGRWAIAMPDIHWGYGFPIGGVAAMRLDDGVVSPGGCRLRHQLRGAAAGDATHRVATARG